MKLWKVVGVLVLALTTGCAVQPYRQAEKHIANKEYRQALQLYMRSLNPHVRDGKRYISYDPEAVTGIGVVLWYMKRYDTAVRILQSVVKRSPEYGKALFYLGACYESQKQLDKALNTYSLYTTINPKDPYRNPARWRLDWVMKVKGNLDVKQTMTDESRISLGSLPKESIAIVYFQNLSPNTRWNPFQKGLAEMIITDLSQVEQLRVTDRIRLENAVQNLRLSQKDLMDDTRSVQLAKLLGARTLVKGTFLVYPDNRLEIRAGTVYVLESKTPEYMKYSGRIEQVLTMEKQIVRKILADLGIKPTTDQERRLADVHTKDWRALLAYSFGTDMMDRGDFKSAQSYFARALSLDPLFGMAQNMVVPLDWYQSTHMQDVAQMQANVSRLLGTSAGEGIGPEGSDLLYYSVNSRTRLQSLGLQMDAGFIPSNDTRKAYNEVEQQELIVRTLPSAPALPFVPERWMLPGPPAPPKKPK